MQRKTARMVSFTKHATDHLTPPAVGREYHYDEKLPGLALCITAARTKTW
jgi:hypothetical protein